MGRLKLGKLDTKVTFRNPNITISSDGEVVTSSGNASVDRWASIKYVGSPSSGASEEEQNEQRTGKMKIEVVCRYFEPIDFLAEIDMYGATFKVYSIHILGKKEGLKLRAELQDDESVLPTFGN